MLTSMGVAKRASLVAAFEDTKLEGHEFFTREIKAPREELSTNDLNKGTESR